MPLDTLLSIVGIEKVLWIDDRFEPLNAEELRTRIHELCATLRAMGHQPQHEFLGPMSTMSAPDEELESVGMLAPELDRLTVPQLASVVTSLISQINNGHEPADLSPVDLNVSELGDLVAALGDVVKPYSPQEWNSVKSSILPSCANKQTLFLIDRDFADRGGPYGRGDDVLGEVLEGTDYRPMCIMFTREAAAGSEEQIRAEVYHGLSGTYPRCRKSHFSVMSKQAVADVSLEQANTESIADRFAKALRIVATHGLCHRIAESSASTMIERLRSAVDELVALSIEDLDKAIFTNSLNEGASEIDVVIRILNLHARVAVQAHISDAGLQSFSDLEAVRRLRSLSPAPPTSGTSELLRRWRHLEVVDPPEYINKAHSPLQCGDLFKVDRNEESKNKVYVLLAAPCDLIVRDTGLRRLTQGTFVEIVKNREGISNSTNDDPSGRYFAIPGINIGSEHPLLLDARKVFYVDLSFLDYVVFHAEGRAELAAGTPKPDALLPGYHLKFDKALASLSKGDVSLCLDSSLKVRSQWESTLRRRSFNLQRIGHIRSPYAQALFAAFAAFQTRAAFEHDFARDDRTASMDVTDTPSQQ